MFKSSFQLFYTHFPLLILFPLSSSLVCIMLTHKLIHKAPKGVDPHRDRQRGALSRTNRLHNMKEVAD